MRKFLMLGAILFSTSSFAADYFGAIAFSTGTGAIGYSWNYPNQAQAEYKALRECRRADCKVVVWTKNACAAIAVGNGNGYGWAWNTSRTAAEEAALTSCSAQTLGCTLRAWLCSNG